MPAEPLFREALAGRGRALGPAHPDASPASSPRAASTAQK